MTTDHGAAGFCTDRGQPEPIQPKGLDVSIKTQAWVTEDDYLGVTGADSLDEMVTAIMASQDALFGLSETGLNVATEAEVRELLEGEVIHPVKVPTAYLHAERWDGSRIFPLGSLDEKPGRGYVKVLGVRL